ncbi:MAG: YbhB/YbcL family Raf kinase inhibitor-like protein [Candidatus Nanohalobium sp.]
MRLLLPFDDEIADRYTQYGENISPKVRFEEVPEDAETIALLMENMNAPETRSVYWIIWNIPAAVEQAPEGLEIGEGPESFEEAMQGNNDFEIIGYEGPKRYPGEERFRFTAYALDTALGLEAGSRTEDLREAMKGHVLDKAEEIRGYTS